MFERLRESAFYQRLIRFAFISGLVLLNLVFLSVVVYAFLKGYRERKFKQTCLTGSEDLLVERGYQPCGFSPPADSQFFCDPGQIPAPSEQDESDVCEYKRQGRRLIVSYRPGK